MYSLHDKPHFSACPPHKTLICTCTYIWSILIWFDSCTHPALYYTLTQQRWSMPDSRYLSICPPVDGMVSGECLPFNSISNIHVLYHCLDTFRFFIIFQVLYFSMIFFAQILFKGGDVPVDHWSTISSSFCVCIITIIYLCAVSIK